MKKVEKQLSQGDLESDGMEATDDERIPLGDSDNRRKKQRREAELDRQGAKAPDDDPPPPVVTDVLDRLDPGVLCQHIIGGVPAEQFEGAMHNLASNFPEAIAGTAFDRGIVDVAAGEKGQDEGKEKLELSSLPGHEEEVLFLIFNLFIRFHRFQFFHPPGPSFVRIEGDCFLTQIHFIAPSADIPVAEQRRVRTVQAV